MKEDALRKFFDMSEREVEVTLFVCPDCGGEMEPGHFDKTLQHAGRLISPCDDKRISKDGP